MSDRLEEIRERAARMRFDDAYDPGADDIPYLLARIEALTVAGDGLAGMFYSHRRFQFTVGLSCGHCERVAAWEKAKGD